mgnify:CR=1 FL=1
MGELTRPFDSVLVANRGEIALRVLRTAAALGYRTIAVYSDADADAPHVHFADEAVRLGPAPVADSYLDVDAVLGAIRRTGAGAVHPGYGFLSENAAFAAAVIEAGAVWVGPPPEAIAAMGDKARAKERMRAAGVPCVPGFDGDAPDDDTLVAAAADVGFPLLVKASAGGGGRGMRAVHAPEELPGALTSARAEAANAFGSDALLLERLVVGARHVEVQVLADAHGAVVHLGERDCSVQRRHQKVVEEAPSPAVTPELRARMGAAACDAARAVDYVGAGTVEFLLGADGSFYFLEMNTRLQVEHPVTEEVFGLDLVALQLSVAEGQPLPFLPEDLRMAGHAIEVRLYAEDPTRGYLPQPGPVHAWRPPPGIRVDAGLGSSGTIDPAYDPMVAKLIAHGPTREVARRRLLRGLEQTVFFGGATNRDLLRRVLCHPTFVAGEATTDFLDATSELAEAPPLDPSTGVVAAALWFRHHAGDHPLAGRVWAHDIGQTVVLDVGDERVSARLRRTRKAILVDVGDGEQQVEVAGDPSSPRVRIDGHQRRAQVLVVGQALHLRWGGRTVVVEAHDPRAEAADAEGDGQVRMPMAGQVLSLAVVGGQAVAAGAVLATVEAMKLETPLRAPFDGVVAAVHGSAGQALPGGAVVVVVQPAAAETETASPEREST